MYIQYFKRSVTDSYFREFKKKHSFWSGMVVHGFNSSTWEVEDLYEFKERLVYIVSSRLARAT